MGSVFWLKLLGRGLGFRRWLGARDIGARGKDYALGRLDPGATPVEMGTGVNGAENGVRTGLGLVGVLDEELGGEAQVLAAAFVEAGGTGVGIDGSEIPEVVILLDQFGIAPGDEILFEVGAVGVVADGAFAGVAL
jgi:hypothetical protein